MPSLTQGTNLDGLPKVFDAVVWLIGEPLPEASNANDRP